MLLSALYVLYLFEATLVGAEGFGNSDKFDITESSLLTTTSMNPAISTSAAVHIADLIQGTTLTFRFALLPLTLSKLCAYIAT